MLFFAMLVHGIDFEDLLVISVVLIPKGKMASVLSLKITVGLHSY